MAAITWAMVVNITGDSTLSGVHVDAQTEILGYVNNHINALYLDEDGYDMKLARVYLAAHMALACVPGSSGSGGGAVTSESGGDGLAVSYATSAVAAVDELGETAWGRRYLALTRAHCAGPVLL